MTDTRIPLKILALWLTGILAAGQFAKVSVTFPAFRALYPDLGPSLGFLVSALSLTGMLFGLLAGVLLTRFGVKRMLIGALMLGGAMSLVQSTLPAFGLMVVTRVIEGASHLAIVVAAPTMVGQIAPLAWRNTAMTLMSAVFAVAFALFSWLGLPLVAEFGLPVLFLLHGGLMIGMAGVLSRLLPRLDLPAYGPLTLRDVVARHGAAYRSAFVAAPAAGWLFYASSFVALVTVIPDFLPAEMRAFVSGSMPLAALVVSLTFGIIMMRFKTPVSVLMVGFVASAALAMALGVIGPAAWLAIAMLGIMGLVQSGSFAAIPALNATPEDQALSNGALAQAGNTGNLIGTPLLLWLVDGFGFAGLIGFALVAFVGGFAIHWLLAARRA